MPRINFNDLDETDDAETFAPIRRDNGPISTRHANQRRAEDGINRYAKQRKAKERARGFGLCTSDVDDEGPMVGNVGRWGLV